MEGLLLNVAIRMGAPVEVVTALLEAYPDAATIRHGDHLPCHFACCYGISAEGMKMLLRCNPDAAAETSNSCGRTPMQYLNAYKWDYFADEKEQVRNDLKQRPSYWKSKEQQTLLQCAFEETGRRRSVRRSLARIILGRQFDHCDLVQLIIEYL
jgi:predicted DNA-binding protein (MmcQ/YjbR family)